MCTKSRTSDAILAVLLLFGLAVSGCDGSSEKASQSDPAARDTSDGHVHSHSHHGDARTGADTADGDTDAGSDSCVPDREAWETNVKAIVDNWCGKCHGKQPKYGAPFSLLDYPALVEGDPGNRRVDQMADAVLSGRMPPANAEPLPHEVEDTLVEWATCGQKHPDHSKDVEASQPRFEAPEQPPEGLETLDVLADNFELGKNQLNHYHCFVVDVPFDSTRFIRRIEPVVDEDRVLHHALVSIDSAGSQNESDFECAGFPPGDGLIFGWAPGLEPIQFDDGGLRLDPGSQVVLQIHYNNGAGVEDVSDESGVRLFLDDKASNEITMAATGTDSFQIPAGERASASGTCTVQQETDILASFPHMHEIGSELHTTVIRENGDEESLIDLTGWSFEAQLAYRTPKTVYPGDKIVTKCVWDNPYERTVGFGLRTEDEMCFNFLYVTPPNPRFCR